MTFVPNKLQGSVYDNSSILSWSCVFKTQFQCIIMKQCSVILKSWRQGFKPIPRHLFVNIEVEKFELVDSIWYRDGKTTFFEKQRETKILSEGLMHLPYTTHLPLPRVPCKSGCLQFLHIDIINIKFNNIIIISKLRNTRQVLDYGRCMITIFVI